MAAAIVVFVDCCSVSKHHACTKHLCAVYKPYFFWRLTKFTIMAVLQLSQKTWLLDGLSKKNLAWQLPTAAWGSTVSHDNCAVSSVILTFILEASICIQSMWFKTQLFLVCKVIRLANPSSHHIVQSYKQISINLTQSWFCSCSSAVLDPTVGHAINTLSPFISVLCYSD